LRKYFQQKFSFFISMSHVLWPSLFTHHSQVKEIKPPACQPARLPARPFEGKLLTTLYVIADINKNQFWGEEGSKESKKWF
jgi:hypothetical protein